MRGWHGRAWIVVGIVLMVVVFQGAALARPAFLGVLQDASEEAPLAFMQRVAGVLPGSPAEQTSVRCGDYIVAVKVDIPPEGAVYYPLDVFSQYVTEDDQGTIILARQDEEGQWGFWGEPVVFDPPPARLPSLASYVCPSDEVPSGPVGLFGGKLGYAFANASTTNRYEPPPAFAHNSSGGVVEIVRTSIGRYAVRFEGLGGEGVPGGHVQVTAFGYTSETCRTNGWSSSRGTDFTVGVLCFNSSGRPANARFTVMVIWPDGS